jgi:hypothetical protein
MSFLFSPEKISDIAYYLAPKDAINRPDDPQYALNREFAVEPPGATRWLIRHAVLGGYIIWWLIRWRGENFC